MAVTLSQKRSKQTVLLFIFVALIIVMGAIFYFKFLKEEEGTLAPELTTSDFVPKVRVDFEILEHPFFDYLEPFPQAPGMPDIGEIGRPNPFLPYY